MVSGVRRPTAALLAMLVLCNVVLPCSGWLCTGHMLVVEVAKLNLNSQELDKLRTLVPFMHDKSGFTHSSSVTECACWQDDLRVTGLEVMSSWHFFDQPYNPDNIANVPQPSDINAATMITSLTSSLERNPVQGNLWEMSFSMFTLIHLVGDIHQPLHTAMLFSEQFPHGDKGGNAFVITYEGKKTNLHSFWDSVGELFSTDLVRPLGQNDTEFLESTAKNLMGVYGKTFTPDQLNEKDPKVWAQEGLALAKTSVYANITAGGEVSQAYAAQAQNVAQSRITLAGLRLARLLSSVVQKALEKEQRIRFLD